MGAAHVDWCAYRTVVLEGCNGVGKTTLATHLGHQGFVVVHSSRTPDSIDLIKRYQAILARAGPIVLDRSFLSELVYGPIYRGRSRLTIDQCRDLSREVAARSGVFVRLSVPAHIIHSRLLTRPGRPAPSVAELEAIIRRYDYVFGEIAAHAPVMRLDAPPPRKAPL